MSLKQFAPKFFVGFWAVACLVLSLSFIFVPGFSVENTFPNAPLSGQARDKAAWLAEGIWIVLLTISALGLFALRTPSIFKTVVVIYVVLTFGGSMVDFYQYDQAEFLGTDATVSLLFALLQLFLFVLGVYSIFVLPPAENSSSSVEIPSATRAFFWVGGVTLLIPSTIFLIDPSGGDFDNSYHTSLEIAQLTLFARILFFYVLVLGLIVLGTRDSPFRAVIVIVSAFYVMALAHNTYALVHKDELGSRVPQVSLAAAYDVIMITLAIVAFYKLSVSGYREL